MHLSHTARVNREETMVVTSTSLRVARRAAPETHAHAAPDLPHPQPARKPREIRRARAEIELPKQRARMPVLRPQKPEPRAVATIDSVTLAREERDYATTIARAKAANDPLVSPSATVPPAAHKRYTLSFAGVNGRLNRGEGILYPTKEWKADGFDYYYVDYSVMYADGSTDEGHVPWPIRYRPSEDPFVLHYRHFPLPAPLPGYVLPQSELPLNRTLRPYFPELYPSG